MKCFTVFGLMTVVEVCGTLTKHLAAKLRDKIDLAPDIVMNKNSITNNNKIIDIIRRKFNNRFESKLELGEKDIFIYLWGNRSRSRSRRDGIG